MAYPQLVHATAGTLVWDRGSTYATNIQKEVKTLFAVTANGTVVTASIEPDEETLTLVLEGISGTNWNDTHTFLQAIGWMDICTLTDEDGVNYSVRYVGRQFLKQANSAGLYNLTLPFRIENAP